MKNKDKKAIPRVEIHTSTRGSPIGYGGGGNFATGLRNPGLNFSQHGKTPRRIRKTERKLVIGTWNVQGWRTKDREVIEEFRKMNMDVLVISETKKKGTGTENIGDIFHCWSGVRKEERAKAGVGILIKKKWQKNIDTWKPIDERMIEVRLNIYGRVITILGVYGPTEDSPVIEKEDFMDKLHSEIQKIKNSEELILTGDLNGRVGRRNDDTTVGRFGEELINDNGERLIEICELNDLKITNGFFKHKDIHKYTWIQETRNLRSIIDYIITKKNSTIKLKDVRVQRGAECGSDHRLVRAKMSFPFIHTSENRQHKNTVEPEKRFKLDRLQDESIKNLYQWRLDQKLEEFRYDSITQSYEHIKMCMKEAAREALGEEETHKTYREDVSDDTRQSIREKKDHYLKYLSTKNPEDLRKYKEKNREVKRKMQQEKNIRWEHTCENIEQYIGGTRSSESWRVLKALRRNNREKVRISYIKEQEWERYYKDLLTETRPQFMRNEEISAEENEQITLTLPEVKRAIKSMKNRKSSGPGGIPPELIKYGTEKLGRMIHAMFLRALNGEELPDEWTEAYITSIHKKGERKKCENYRGISVIASMGRLFGKVVKQKLEEQIQGKVDEDQAGFTAGRSCIDHIYTIQQLIEKKMAKNREVHFAFVDIRKAYDSVPRSKIWEAMLEIGIPQRIIRTVQNMYNKNTVKIKEGNKLSNAFKTTKGLLQGCSTSPTLFKIFLQQTLRPWKRKCAGMGIPIRNDHLYTLSFADDQVIIAQDEEDLGFMMRKLEEEYGKNGVEINLEKTQYMSTAQDRVCHLEIDDNRQISGTDKFKYLGFIISKSGTTEEEIKNRLGQTRACINQLNPILWDRHITKTNKTRIFNSIVRSIMTYGAEMWVINKKNKGKIVATEMDFWRRSCGVNRLDRIRNEEIRGRMEVKKDILEHIEEKKLTWYGHVRRTPEDRWIHRVTEWSPLGRRKRGRPRRSWRDEVDEAMELRNLQDGDWQDKDNWRQGLKAGRQRQL